MALDVPEIFDDGIRHILYEADPEAIPDMRARNRRPNVEIVPRGLGAHDGPQRFHVTMNRYGSSLFQPNPDYRDYVGEVHPTDGPPYDSRMGDWCAVDRSIDIELRRLDTLVRDGLPSPDFLSLDVQGGELAVLEGAAGCLERSVLAVVSEVEFHRIYRDQPTFSEIAAFLDSRGFDFAGFTDLRDHISPRRASIGLRGRALQAWGDALFLRRLTHLPARDASSGALAATKLGFLAMAFGQVEFALAAIEHARALSPDPQAASFRYGRFMRDLWSAAGRMEARYLPDRPKPGSSRRPARNAYRRAMRALEERLVRWPEQRIRDVALARPQEAVLRALCYAMRRGNALFGGARMWRDTSVQCQGLTAFERVLHDYQMHDICRLVRHRRLTTIDELD